MKTFCKNCHKICTGQTRQIIAQGLQKFAHQNTVEVGNLKTATDLVVLGIGEDYAKGLLPITFHSNRVTIYVAAGPAQTPQNWMRVKLQLCN